MLGKAAVIFLAAVGLLTLPYLGWRTSIHATADEGFWFSYYCGDWPVKVSEVDANHDRHVDRQEASAACSGWLNRREFKARACVEYMEPKTGVPIYMSCRVEQSEVH